MVSQPAHVNPKRILIVDDEEPMRELLRIYLEAEGYVTGSSCDGEEALHKLQQEPYDLILLDLMMPKYDGFDVCKMIRSKSTIPIIMLTAREDTVDKVVGLKIGADDYLTKPFEHQELLARIEALFRRQHYPGAILSAEFPSNSSQPKTVLIYHGLALNVRTHQVFFKDIELSLTPKEYAILRLFLSHKGRIFQREDILELLWKSRPINDDRTVDTHIKNLREKLSKAGIPGHEVIKTIWGTGYICNDAT